MKIKNIRKIDAKGAKNNLRFKKRRLEIFKAGQKSSFILFLATFSATTIQIIGKNYLDGILLSGLSGFSFYSLANFSRKLVNVILENIQEYPELQNKLKRILKHRDRSFITFLIAYPSFLGKFLEGNYSTTENVWIGLLGGISILTCLSSSVLTVLFDEYGKEQNNILKSELDIIDLDTEEGELKLLR